MSVEVAEEFFLRVQKYNAITEEQRLHILLEMVNEGLIDGAFQTDMSKDEFVDAVGEDFNVLSIEPKEEPKHDQLGTEGN